MKIFNFINIFKFKIKNYLIGFLLVFFIILPVLFGYYSIIGMYMNDPYIELIPLNKPKDEYIIKKNSEDGFYYLKYKTKNPDSTYFLSRCFEKGDNFENIFAINYSSVDLEPFIDKKVKIEGNFKPYKEGEQCIKNKCKIGLTSINNIKITSISLAK